MVIILKVNLFDVLSHNLTEDSSTKYILTKIEKHHFIIEKRFVCNYYSINTEIKHQLDKEHIVLPNFKKYKVVDINHKEKFIIFEEIE